MTLSKQKDSLRPILSLCVLRRGYAEDLSYEINLCLAILMGEGRKEKMPSLLALPSVPGGTHYECQSSLRVGPGVGFGLVWLLTPPSTPPAGGKKEPS